MWSWQQAGNMRVGVLVRAGGLKNKRHSHPRYVFSNDFIVKAYLVKKIVQFIVNRCQCEIDTVRRVLLKTYYFVSVVIADCYNTDIGYLAGIFINYGVEKLLAWLGVRASEIFEK